MLTDSIVTKVGELITHLREKFKAMESMEALGEKVKNLGDTVEKLKESVEGTDCVSYANVAARSEGNLRNQPGVVAGGFRQTQPRVDLPKTKFFRFYKSNETEEARAERIKVKSCRMLILNFLKVRSLIPCFRLLKKKMLR